MISSFDEYITTGCMRCKYGGTPECKVHPWKEVLLHLRELILQTPLQEEIKWSVPCYTFNGKNVAIISAFKDYCAISFFKGALLEDPENLLVK